MDARKRYTQMVLKQSFLKLLKEKPVNRITVKEVCALAQLNRATFYAHYSDCFALMESIENELIDAFEKSLRYVNSFDVTALIEAIYDMVDQNQTACRVLQRKPVLQRIIRCFYMPAYKCQPALCAEVFYKFRVIKRFLPAYAMFHMHYRYFIAAFIFKLP